MKKALSVASAVVLAGGMVFLTGLAIAQENPAATLSSAVTEQLAQDGSPSIEPEAAASSAAGDEQSAEPDQTGSAPESTSESSEPED